MRNPVFKWAGSVIITLLLTALFSVDSHAQGAPGALPCQGAGSGGSTESILSHVAGVYDSRNYACWTDQIFGPPTTVAAASPATFTLRSGTITLPDGRDYQPFFVGQVVLIGAGPTTVREAVTLTGVSGCFRGAPQGSCTISGNTSNPHGPGELVTSGSQGIGEAINDASVNNNGGLVFWEIDPGIVTLSTGGANTTLGSVSIPTRSVVMSATARVTTTIATCAGGWSLGWSTGTEFTAANTTLTAGTTSDSSTITLPADVIAATVPIAHCTTSNASAGAIHAHFSGYKLAAPNQ